MKRDINQKIADLILGILLIGFIVAISWAGWGNTQAYNDQVCLVTTFDNCGRDK